MLDTIKIICPSELRSPGRGWDQIKTSKNGHDRVKYILNNRSLRLTLMDYHYVGPRVTAEFSLPKLLHGHNIIDFTPSEIRDAFMGADDVLKGVMADLPTPSVFEWTVQRADFCTSSTIDNVDARINDIRSTIKVRKSQVLDSYVNKGGGAGFSLRGASIHERLYNKRSETQHLIRSGKIDKLTCKVSAKELQALSEGLMRYEIEMNAEALQPLLGSDRSVSSLIKFIERDGEEFIKRRWEKLTREWDASPRQDVAKLLKSAYPQAGCSLHDFYFHINSLGIEEYKATTGIPESSLQRKLKQLRDAGIRLGTITSSFGDTNAEGEEIVSPSA